MSKKPIFFKEEILNLLDWNIISQILKNNCYFSRTAQDLNGLPKHFDAQLIQQNHIHFNHFETLYTELNIELKDYFQFFNSEFDFLNKSIYLSKSGVINIEEINQFFLLYDFFDRINPLFNSIDNYFNLKKNINPKYNEFRKFVSKEGVIDLDKHPLLSNLNQDLFLLENTIRKSIIEFINKDNIEKVLQFKNYDILNDHYVIPVRSDSYNYSIGQIISRSETGNTLFVEPFEIRDLSNRRLEILNKINEIIHNICISFSGYLKNELSTLNHLINLLYNFDKNRALFEFYSIGTFSFPEISDTPQIILNNFFHPLISNPVKNSIKLDNSQSGLIISGPNMGGKTATLKSVALSYLFFIKGFKIPATHASIYPYDGFYFFGNDEQNLEKGDSSFSGEVKKYLDLVDNLKNFNLIFFDEIFNTTSSEEASALAMSLFRIINEQSFGHFFVSTHHQMLKTYLHNDQSFISCHVGFSNDLGSPNYKLYFDGPGSSHAVEIFRKLANTKPYAQAILTYAENILDKKYLNYEKLLQELSLKNSALDKKLHEVNDLEKQLANLKKSEEGLIKIRVEKAKDDFEIKIKKALGEIETIKNNQNLNLKTKLNNISKIRNEILPTESKPIIFETLDNELINIDNLILGNRYFCLNLKSDVTLKKIIKNQAEVSKGSITVKVPISSLRKSRNNEIKDSIHVQIKTNGQISYDCRGMRVEEFENTLNNILFSLTSHEVPFVDVIHGHGDGILKRFLKEYIKKSTDLAFDLNDSGNDGQSRLILKN